MEHELVCQSCGTVHESGAYPTGCPDCRREGSAGRLEVRFDPDDIPASAFPTPGTEASTPNSMWRYRELLPLLRPEPLSIGEGGTPVVEVRRETERHGVTVLLKNETVNPTWSFKDRLNSLLLSNVAELSVDRIATSSTGNHGASTAAYASLAGIEDVIVLLPPDTEAPLQAQIRAYGADVVVTEYDRRGILLEQLVERDWYPTVNVTEPYTGLPYSYEAYKTIAFELVDQLETVPDAILMGIGAGDGLYGIWKGFRELTAADVVDDPPKMVGVQPAERPAVVEALDADAETVGTVEGPMPITTSAGGTSAGDHVLRAIRESDGDAYAIERESIEAAIRATAREGVFLEPASANTVAGVEAALDDGLLDTGDTVVCIGTGAGVKWPEHTEGAVGTVPEIPATLEALAEAVDPPLER